MMKHTKGLTIWFTGLSGAGKSTLATLLEDSFSQRGLPVVLLDGDEVRNRLTNDLGFTREDREENIRRIAYVAKLLTNVGGVVIVAAISPYAHARQNARREIANFVEVFVKCPLHVCIERDTKGLYAKAQRKEISHFTGISDPYEEPQNPEILVETDTEQPQESLKKILKQLEQSEFLKPYTEG